MFFRKRRTVLDRMNTPEPSVPVAPSGVTMTIPKPAMSDGISMRELNLVKLIADAAPIRLSDIKKELDSLNKRRAELERESRDVRRLLEATSPAPDIGELDPLEF